MDVRDVPNKNLFLAMLNIYRVKEQEKTAVEMRKHALHK